MKRTTLIAAAAVVTAIAVATVATAADQDAESCCRLGNGIVCCAREIMDWLWDNGMPW